ncbi:MAG: RimK-like ATPgrasp N-terminal domain-containing protein [Methanoregula sp.]|nr:RimK-like ATPgrasp N-terminal domain-containing protein [Methanoregula sp.]
MNDRWGEPPQAGSLLQLQGTDSSVPAIPILKPGTINQFPTVLESVPVKKLATHANGKRELAMLKDSLFIMKQGGFYHIISEDYSYKSEPYYTIIQHELEDKPVRPSSRAVLDAYVVPCCLERAKRAGIPICEWGISQAYVPLPALLYGLNYFATSSDYFVVDDNEQAKEVIKHITNKGKYPFCYQKLGENATVHACTAIFGKTVQSCSEIATSAAKIYNLFSIPLVQMVFVKTGTTFALSSLSPVRYNHLSENERALLSLYLDHQEFL